MSVNLLQHGGRQTPGLGKQVRRPGWRLAGAVSPADVIARFLLVGLLAVLIVHGIGVGQDFVTAGHYPYQLDYGEGIVWQQAVLIPGQRMYSRSTQLPFVVFHYPPVYHLLTHVFALFCPDLLSAGRVLSSLSAGFVAATVTSLILAMTKSQDGQQQARRWCCALVGGLLIFSAYALRCWAMFMRVDALAEAIALAGTLVAARSNNSLIGTTGGLLLCVAAVYCKQTELPAGIAVFAVTLLLRPRTALVAGGLALTFGSVPLVLLQWITHGGFLHNIVSQNVNRMSLTSGYLALMSQGSSLSLIVAVVFSACALLRTLRTGLMSDGLMYLEAQANRARLMLLAQFGLATLMLLTVFKSGSNMNYFIDWHSVGCTLVGSCLYDLLRKPRFACYLLVVLCAGSLRLPFRLLPDSALAAERAADATLVERIARASRPVASEDMVLLMRAGKPVIFEPAIVTELAALGRWDERPLVRMITSRSFEFMVTSDNVSGPTPRRSAAVAAAMQHSYPVVEQVGPSLWLHRQDQRTQVAGPD